MITADAGSTRTAEQVLAAVLARTGPVTVYGDQVDAAEPAEIITIQEAFGPQAHRAPMTLCLRRQYNSDAWGPVGDFADDGEQLTLTDTAGRRLVVVRRTWPTTFDVAVGPAGVVLAPAHVDALRQFLTGDEDLLTAEERADADDATIRELRAIAARELEEHLRETGRQRTRAEAAEELLRRHVAAAIGVVAAPGSVLHDARALLGMDGRTGGPGDDGEAGRD